jgi:cell division protein FtsQ
MAGLDRLERDTRRRRERAHSHLSRLRERGHGSRGVRPGPRRRLPRGLVLATLAAAALAGVLADHLFIALGGAGRVDAIAVRGASRLTPQEIAAATGIPRGALVSEVEPDAVARKLAENDWIASARALRLPTGKVVVEVAEREPLAQLAIGDRRFAIDERGAAFAELASGQETSLPRLVTSQAPEPGVPDALRAEAARLPERLPALGLAAPEEIRVAPPGDPEGVSLRLPGLDGLVVLGREALDQRLRDLAKLLALRPDEASRAARIDLRFADQAVLRSAAAREGPQGAARSGGVAPPSTRSAG